MPKSELVIRYTADNGCRFLEERDAPIKDRIAVICLTKTPEGTLVDPETGQSLKKMFTLLTGVDHAEDRANSEIEEKVGESGKLVVWLSPPHLLRSQESRINFYVSYQEEELEEILPYAERILINKEGALKRIRANKKLILLFALPSQYQVQECLTISQQIAALCSKNPNITSSEDLRDNPWIINVPNKYWVSATSEFFDFGDPEVWKRIKNGTVFIMREEANRASFESAQKRLHLIYLANESLVFKQELEYQTRKDAQEAGFRLKSGNRYCHTVFDAFDFQYNLAQNRVPFDSSVASQEEFDYPFHTGNCKACGANNIDVGPCDICKDCDRKIRRSASYN